MERVWHALNPGGVVYLDVPNECSLWCSLGNAYMRARGRAWAVNLSPTFPPFHVVGFCPRSLRFLLSSIGFRVLTLETYQSELPLPRTTSIWSRAERLASDRALDLGVRLGMGAGITCWAQRP
jgi:hypothetical protein